MEETKLKSFLCAQNKTSSQRRSTWRGCFDMSALFMSNQIKLMRFSPSFIVAHSSAGGRTDEHGIIITSNTIIPSPEKCALSDSVSSLKSRLIQLLMLGHDSG